MTAPPVPAPWADLPFFRDDWPTIAARLRDRDWLPGPGRVFAALALTPPAAARVVILGQDPYPTPGHANGLAFSVTPETALPRWRATWVDGRIAAEDVARDARDAATPA